ncbi:MAG: M28 family peptidase [Verrucomicrobiae bacterium]|nr:M28 family peptidase [Verrucomicrobiae bacterium]NNJ42036.1 M28 family peptidase [Akkermansiaceae bacterium]
MKTKISVALILLAAVVAGIWYWQQDDTQTHGHAAYAHTEAILACGPRPAGSDGLQCAHSYISKELAQHGWSTMSQTFERDTPIGKRTFINLIARYQPSDLSSLDELKQLPTRGILSAHLDSKLIPGIPDFLGADDAASACALIIELAANLARNHPKLAKQLELVFFDGEEAFNENIDLSIGDGLYGSRAYAITLYDRNPKPSFGIVLDMVGHKNLQIAVPADSPPELYASMMRSAKLHGEDQRFGKASTGIIDDHYYLNKAGVPTIDIIGAGFSDSHWWHQQGDDMDLISAQSLDISYHVTMTMLEELLTKD